AYHAAASGARVVEREEVRHVRTGEITHSEPAMSALLYKESGLQATVDLEMTILQGRALGGTTVINNAICFRLGDAALTRGRDVLGEWATLGARLDRARLDASYQAVERMVGVKPLGDALVPDVVVPPGTPGGPNGKELLDGWQALLGQRLGDPAFQTGLFRVNFDRCLSCGYCNFGCPYARRLSVLETYLPQATARGARLIPECHAVQIVTQRDRAVSVRAELADGRAIEVRAGTVVVACGTIGSSVLLLKSGIRRNVGSRFSCNVATPVLARFAQRLDAFESLQMTAFVRPRLPAREHVQPADDVRRHPARVVREALRPDARLRPVRERRCGSGDGGERTGQALRAAARPARAGGLPAGAGRSRDAETRHRAPRRAPLRRRRRGRFPGDVRVRCERVSHEHRHQSPADHHGPGGLRLAPLHCGMNVQHRKTWKNHLGNQAIQPLRLYAPESLDDVVALVREAERSRCTVRAVGSGHSWSDVALTPGFLVDTSGLSRILDLEPQLLRSGVDAARLVRAEAGIRLRELNAHLDAH